MVNWFVLLATMLVFPAIAEAQIQTGGNFPSLLIPIEPPEALPASGTEGGFLFNLRPLGAHFGQTLADHGVYLVGRDLSEEISVVSGGAKQGSSFEGYTALGFDLDMDHLAGFHGGAVHLLLDDLQGKALSTYSGSFYLNDRIFAGDGPAFRLQDFSYEQILFNRQVDLRLGRLEAYTQFDGSELYCTFIVSLCRTPSAFTFDRGYPPYLASSWAAVAQIRISGPFYVNLGVYENEPIAATTNHGGFPGPDWGLNYANGATFPVQFGYRTTVQNDQYPRAFSVGGFYATGDFADPVLNTHGQNRILDGGTPKTDYGMSQIYVQGQQMVYRPDASDRGLTLFGGANWATSGEPAVERMFFAGGYLKGPFAPRPNDTFGLAVSLVEVNPRITERVDSTLSKSGGGRATEAEISYEAWYRFDVAPGLAIKPFVGFMSHPDQATVVRPSGNDTHAIYLGALLIVDLAHLFGLPALSL